jgi:glutathione S-transferase
MKPKLYQFHSSPFCAKVRKILDYKGFEYEVVEVDYLDRRALVEASGQIMVPALQFDDETVVDSNTIANRLEQLRPFPTIFPPASRGLHLSLTRYFEEQLEDVIFRVALPDEIEHFRRQGRDREAFFRFIRERKYGSGFCERMEIEHVFNLGRMNEALEPLEESLERKGFLLGRIGLSDFALYGQLWYLGFTGELKIPPLFENLRAFFGRIDRISAELQTDET